VEARRVTTLDLADIQGNILRGYGARFPHARYLFVRVTDPGAARRRLAELAGPLETAEEWEADDQPPFVLNVAISHAGLRALELPSGILDSFPCEFRAGMAARATLLGDADDNAPCQWQEELRAGRIEILLYVGAPDDTIAPVAEHWRAWLGRPGGGLEVTFEQAADALPGAREHFGFSDGFAQPAIAGAARETVRGQGVPERWWPWQRETPDRLRSASDRRVAWRALRPGEFVLGYEDEDGSVPPAPRAPFDRNGTYMVWRKLEQDVAGFRASIADSASRLRVEEEWLAARLVGRWKDGSPLPLRPHGPDEVLGYDLERVNDFAYGRDRDGLRCPRGAHVRRVNPRDALGHAGKLTARHRIIRRGMPYGPPLPEHGNGANNGGAHGAERGLIFVALQASIARQFEIVQSQWCNDGDPFGLGHETDPIACVRPSRPIIEGRPPRFVPSLPPFVRTRGGEYLFMPSVSSLRALATI
jgi:Dyp-type peroxidase family